MAICNGTGESAPGFAIVEANLDMPAQLQVASWRKISEAVTLPCRIDAGQNKSPADGKRKDMIGGATVSV